MRTYRLAEEVDEIRSMAIDGLPHRSCVRRGHMVRLFQEHGCFADFVERHWPYGGTQGGATKLRRYESLRARHMDLLAGTVDEEEDEADELTQRFGLEAHLRDFLVYNIATLEPGLRVFEADGRNGVEYAIDSGRIDLLAVDAHGRHVVVELKLSKGRNKALGQLLYYMGWVDDHLPNPPCRGIIVADEITAELRTAVSRVPGVSLYRYRVRMEVEKVPAAS